MTEHKKLIAYWRLMDEPAAAMVPRAPVMHRVDAASMEHVWSVPALRTPVTLTPRVTLEGSTPS